MHTDQEDFNPSSEDNFGDLRNGFGSHGYASMIIRLVQVPGGSSGAEGASWRSEVEHIQSGENREFSSLVELEQFLQDFLRQLEGKSHLPPV